MLFTETNIVQKLIREIFFKKSSERHSTTTMFFTVALEVPSMCAPIQISGCLTRSKGFVLAVLSPILAIGALEFIGTLFGAEVKQAVAKAMDQVFFNVHTNISLST
jgi:hypothetical protein